MKIKLLVNHVLGKKGDVIQPAYGIAKYLIKTGRAIEYKQTKIDKEEKEITKKIVDDGSKPKKRATRKSKTNIKP